MIDAPITATDRSSPWIGRVDRLLPLLWLGIYLLLPVSGLSDLMFTSWHDQERDLAALRDLLAKGSSSTIDDNIIGPGYVLAAAVIHWLFGLSPESALVTLARASYALSVAIGLLMVRVLLGRIAAGGPLVSLSGQILFLGLMLVTATWYWSDIPWSHFYATVLVVSLYALRLALVGPALGLAIGTLLGLLASTRTFELVAVLLAWACALAISAVFSLPERGRVRLPTVAAFVASFVGATAVSYLATGKRAPFVYGYHPHLDEQDVLSAGAAAAPVFSIDLIPTKLVQLVVDPCYLALCGLVDNGGVAFWREPLGLQLPALLLLPAVVVGMVWLAVQRRLWADGARELRLMGEMAIAATGLVLGYVGSTMTGSPHLKFGFARDLILPALLVAVLISVLATVGMRHALLRRGEARGASDALLLPAALGLVVLLVATVTVARRVGLPTFESRHLGAVTYTARCARSVCEVHVAARTTKRSAIRIPSRSTLTFSCAGDGSMYTIYARDPSSGVSLPETCHRPRLRSAWPLVMGLPPDLAHMSRVTVIHSTVD